MQPNQKWDIGEKWVIEMVNEYGWRLEYAWGQFAMVLCGIRDGRLHDNCISLIDELEKLEYNNQE